MKKFYFTLFIIFIFTGILFSKPDFRILNDKVIQVQISFDPNKISTWIQNTGIFNQDIRTNNTPGAMWPINTNRFVFYTAGFTMAAIVNGSIRMASCSYAGEYAPGYSINGVPFTNADFKHYKVYKIDGPSNPDYANWYKMIPYGAPFIDINNNGVYDNGIDKPGVKGAEQTVFICMTDGYQENHTSSTGFSGGTLPLYSEMRLTAWGYTKQEYVDIQFFKLQIINKGTSIWDSLYTAFIVDPDLGRPEDDYIGCDTIRQMGYVYNADNDDENGNPPSYGLNPPAAGMIYHKGMKYNYQDLGMTAFSFFVNPGAGGPFCEATPSLPLEAYRFLKGIKKDGSSWYHPFSKQRVRKLYTGLPETNQGWTELGYNGNPNLGRIKNCLGGDTITTYINYPGDRRYIMASGNDNLKVMPGDTQTVIMSQLVARGTNNLNSVYKLRQLADVAWELYNSGFTIGIQNISSEIPMDYELYQNYPNPFNPETKIKFDIKSAGNVKLVIYDIQGRIVNVLVNESMKAGSYTTDFYASGLPSGIYFYKMETGTINITRKMILIK